MIALILYDALTYFVFKCLGKVLWTPFVNCQRSAVYLTRLQKQSLLSNSFSSDGHLPYGEWSISDQYSDGKYPRLTPVQLFFCLSDMFWLTEKKETWLTILHVLASLQVLTSYNHVCYMKSKVVMLEFNSEVQYVFFV